MRLELRCQVRGFETAHDCHLKGIGFGLSELAIANEEVAPVTHALHHPGGQFVAVSIAQRAIEFDVGRTELIPGSHRVTS